jgi:hypothetical protein
MRKPLKAADDCALLFCSFAQNVDYVCCSRFDVVCVSSMFNILETIEIRESEGY